MCLHFIVALDQVRVAKRRDRACREAAREILYCYESIMLIVKELDLIVNTISRVVSNVDNVKYCPYRPRYGLMKCHIACSLMSLMLLENPNNIIDIQ